MKTRIIAQQTDEETEDTKTIPLSLHVEPQRTKNPPLPMFPSIGRKDVIVHSVKLTRLEPNTGYIGEVEPTITEQEIRERFGGRVFQLSCIGLDGEKIPGGIKILTIEAEPKVDGKPMMQTQHGTATLATSELVTATREATRIKEQALLERLHEERELRAAERKRLEDERQAERQRLQDERKAELERIKSESEFRLRELQTKAELERKEAQERFERQQQAERQRAEQRERELIAEKKAEKENQERFFMTLMQLNKENHAVVMQAMQNQNQGNAVATALKEGLAIAAQLNDGKNQEDPAKIVGEVSKGITGLVELAQSHSAENKQTGKKPTENKAAKANHDITKRLISAFQKLKEEAEAAGLDPMTVLEGIEAGEFGLVDKDGMEELERVADENKRLKEELAKAKQNAQNAKANANVRATGSQKPATATPRPVVQSQAGNRPPQPTRPRGRPPSQPKPTTPPPGPASASPANVGTTEH